MVVSGGAICCGGSGGVLPEIESLNSRMPVPRDRPISGNRLPPKSSSAISKRMAMCNGFETYPTSRSVARFQPDRAGES